MYFREGGYHPNNVYSVKPNVYELGHTSDIYNFGPNNPDKVYRRTNSDRNLPKSGGILSLGK